MLHAQQIAGHMLYPSLKDKVRTSENCEELISIRNDTQELITGTNGYSLSFIAVGTACGIIHKLNQIYIVEP
jgi:hypothetical protein